MDKVLSVYVSAGDSMNARYASLSLPATPYELLDALDKTSVFEQVYDITQEYLVPIESALDEKQERLP